MTIGSLFSGIGGLELGLEWAGLGPTIWQVEKDAKLRNCLQTHWPDAERFEDVKEVGKHNLKPVDLICGGFPCQDISSAGKRAGLSGARSGLWFEFSRIVSELRPKWVVVENVTSGASKWVDAVREDLERVGYSSLPIPLQASDCGAWHRRARIFLIAYSYDQKLAPAVNGNRKGVTSRAITHVDKKQIRNSEKTEWEGGSKPKKHTPKLNGQWKLQSQGRKSEFGRWSCDGEQWSTEPDVARMVHGLPGRVDRERALGNSVVPQCAEVVGEVINLFEQ